MDAPGFTGSPLDRVDHVRSDADAYAALLGNWRARLLVLDGPDLRLSDDGMLVWTTLGDADGELILLGVLDDVPHFVTVPPDARVASIRSASISRILMHLAADDAAIYGTALSLIGWHNTHRFCARCGGPTRLFRAGWGRQCTVCATDHFPRTDPVVIMLAEHGDSVLVGRQSRFPPGNYSALAGFLEPGESIEDAVRRELFEEAGIRAGAVRYVASQPWPFGGSQLMIGCITQANDTAITLDTDELEDAMWVTRAEVQAAIANDPDRRFSTPPPFAIAHSLFLHWLAGA